MPLLPADDAPRFESLIDFGLWRVRQSWPGRLVQRNRASWTQAPTPSELSIHLRLRPGQGTQGVSEA